MLVPFNTLPESSKIWIYQSSRLMNDEEVQFIQNSTENFIESWTAHQADLKSGVQILFNTFILIAVDESHNDASGCSIDKKVHFLKEMEKQTGLELFNRMNFAYRTTDTEVCISPLSELNSAIQSGKLNYDTVVFNNLVTTIREMKQQWQIPLQNSWMMNFVDKTKA